MRRNLLNVMRRRRGNISLAVVFAFLLPLLIGILPVPALSAGAQLNRDLSYSICQTQPVKGQPAGRVLHVQHCILCAAPAAASGGAGLGSSVAVAAPIPRETGVALVAEQAPGRHRLDLRDIAARGPPAA